MLIDETGLGRVISWVVEATVAPNPYSLVLLVVGGSTVFCSSRVPR